VGNRTHDWPAHHQFNSKGLTDCFLIQKHSPIQRVALDRLEAGVADDSAEFFFRGAVTGARGLNYILFQHD
jgi:hypothetical protein